MEEKKEYINRVFRDAIAAGLCRKQKEFAELLGLDPSTMSSVLNGKEKYLTDSVIRRIQAWEKQVLEPRRGSQPYQQQRPDIVIPAATADMYNNMSETIRIQAEIISRLQGGAALYPAPFSVPPSKKASPEL